ncbi:MAG: hypothetical protein QME05_01175 [Candidatus Margulisbacteria bacterium]|nr:hypothetical protein [Candidatus Margulisiibacteriota bacterium]
MSTTAAAANLSLTSQLQARRLSSAQRLSAHRIIHTIAAVIARRAAALGLHCQNAALIPPISTLIARKVSKQKLQPDQLAEELFEAVKPLIPDQYKPAIIAVLEDSGIILQLVDWAKLEGVVPTDLLAEAKQLEKADLRRATAYFRRIVLGFESGQQRLSADHFITALEALVRIDPADPTWPAKLRRETESLQARARAAAGPPAATGDQQEGWKRIKTAIAQRVKNGGASSSDDLRLFALLSDKGDLPEIKRLLSVPSIHSKNAEEGRVELARAFLRQAESAEIRGVLQAIEREQRTTQEVNDYRIAALLAKILPDSELIKKLPDYYVQAAVDELAVRELLPLMLEWLADTKYAGIAAKILPRIAAPEDLDLILSQLEPANRGRNTASNYEYVWLDCLKAVVDRSNYKVVLPLLVGHQRVAETAIEIFVKFASAEDIPALREAAENMEETVRVAAALALLDLEAPDAQKIGEQVLALQEGTIHLLAEKMFPIFPIEYSAAEALQKLLKGEDEKKNTGRFAQALSEDDITSDRFNLRRMLVSPSQTLVGAALAALERWLPGNGFTCILEAYAFIAAHHPSHAKQARAIMAKLVNEAHLPPITQLLSSGTPAQKQAATELALALKAAHLIGLVCAAAQDSPELQERLIEYYEQEGEWERICEFLTPDAEEKVKKRACRAIIHLSDASRLEALQHMLTASNPVLASAAVCGITEILVPSKKPPTTTPIAGQAEHNGPLLGDSRITRPATAEETRIALRAMLESPIAEWAASAGKALTAPEPPIQKTEAAPPTSPIEIAEPSELAEIRRGLVHYDIKVRAAAIRAATRSKLVDVRELMMARFRDRFKKTKLLCFEYFAAIGPTAAEKKALIGMAMAVNYKTNGTLEACLPLMTEADLPQARAWAEVTESYQYDERQVRMGLMVLEKFDPNEALCRAKQWIIKRIKGTDLIEICFAVIGRLGKAEEVETLLAAADSFKYHTAEQTQQALFSAICRLSDRSTEPLLVDKVVGRQVQITFDVCLSALRAQFPDQALSTARRQLASFQTAGGFIKEPNSGSNSAFYEGCPALIRTLGGLGSEADLGLLFEQMEHPWERVREASAEAIRQILSRAS